MNSNKTRAKTAGGTLVDLGIPPISVSSNNFFSSRFDPLPPSRPRNEHPLNYVSFPTKGDAGKSAWLPSPVPVPKQSHSARKFAKPSPLVNLSAIPIPPNMSPLMATRNLGFNRHRKNLNLEEFSPPSNYNASNKPVKSPKKESKCPRNFLKKPDRSKDNKIGNDKIPNNDTPLQLIPVSSLSLVKCPGSNTLGERMQVVRTEEERERNPESIRLDKCGLKQFPLISPQAEHNLKLLSMQHNVISKLENVPSLNHLVVLDLYDNRIERISGLQGLSSLRVLLLGKNRLRRIEGIDVLKRLEVLDLHGNQLRYVDNLSSLGALRVLNLAGNNFKTIRLGSYCLNSLNELNLKRNRIRSLEGLQKAPHLKKLLLANNDISNISSLYHLRKLVFLQELLLEPNPVCNSPDYGSHILTIFPWLEVLDRSDISDEMRVESKIWHRKRLAEEEDRRQQIIKSRAPSSREEVILEARRRWQSVRNFVKSASSKDSPETNPKNNKVAPISSNSNTSNHNIVPATFANVVREIQSLPNINAVGRDGGSTNFPGDLQIDGKFKEEVGRADNLQANIQYLPRVASDSELFKREPTLNTKAELEAKQDTFTVLSDPEESCPEEKPITFTPKNMINRQPSKIAVVRPLVRSSVDDPELQNALISKENLEDLPENFGASKPLEDPNGPEIQITNYDDDLILKQDPDDNLNLEMEEKSDLSSVTQQDDYPAILEQVEGESETEDNSAEPKDLIFPGNLNAVKDIIEENLNQISKSMTDPDLLNFEAGMNGNDEIWDHDNEPSDLLNIFPRSKHRSRKVLKRSASTCSLAPAAAAAESADMNFSVDIKQPSGNPLAMSNRSSKLKAMRNLRSASFDVRYPSSESDSSDDTSSFLTANTSETSQGPRSGRKFFARSKTKVKRDNKQAKGQLPGRRPQTSVRDLKNSRTLKRCDSAASDMSTSFATAIKKQGADYLVEIDGKILNVYGQGALKFTLMGFPNNLSSNITTAKFNYISFDTIIPYFGKLRQIYPNLEHFQFRANNLSTLAQLNSLADLQGITSLYLTKEGNPLITNELWQSYAVYRLTHWGLKSINGKEVSVEIRNGSLTKCFDSLGYVALSCLPQTALTPLAKRLHTLHCFCCCSPSSSSDDSARRKGTQGAGDTPSSVCNSWDDDPVLLDVIGKEALVYNPPAGRDPSSAKEQRTEVPGRIITAGVEILQKLDLLENCWPSVLNELIQDILMDYLFMDSYMKKEYKKLQDVALIRKFP